MKKEKKIQQFEKIIDSNEQLSLEMKNLKGGTKTYCSHGTLNGTVVTCNTGVTVIR